MSYSIVILPECFRNVRSSRKYIAHCASLAFLRPSRRRFAGGHSLPLPSEMPRWQRPDALTVPWTSSNSQSTSSPQDCEPRTNTPWGSRKPQRVFQSAYRCGIAHSYLGKRVCCCCWTRCDLGRLFELTPLWPCCDQPCGPHSPSRIAA